MKTMINEALADLESEHGFRILYACESGSRAWGFASADSDYDVRFIYAWPHDRYLGVFDPPATIDCGIDENALDLTGWDLRKALALFRKSNGSLYEWLHSPIVYREDDPVVSEWRSLAPEFFLPKNSAGHYLGLSKQIWGRMTEKDDATVTAKKYLYVLRSILASRFVVERRKRIPVPFDDLRAVLELSEEISSEIGGMISAKADARESDEISRSECLDRFIETERDRLDLLIDELPSEPGPVERLDQFFRSVITQT